MRARSLAAVVLAAFPAAGAAGLTAPTPGARIARASATPLDHAPAVRRTMSPRPRLCLALAVTFPFALASSGCSSDASSTAAGEGGSGAASTTGAGTSTGAGGGGSGAHGVGLSITPKSVTVPPYAQQTFLCTENGEPNADCTWAVTDDGGGTISDAGIYKAPAAVGTFHVVATSVADPSKQATATVVVPEHHVADCGALPAPGTWENITPPEVWAGFGQQQDYGAFAFVVDPVNSGTVYLGTARQKIWKSTDCGATWTHVNTGLNGDALDAGMQWTFVIDPTDSNVLYTNTGYGLGNGAYKSTNAGVDWRLIWPPADPAQADHVEYNFANVFAMNPTDHRHLLLTFHAQCKPPYEKTCIAETKDGGDTWRVVNGHPSWVGTEGLVIYFLEKSDAWLFASQSNGFWRTDDAGETWYQVNQENSAAHPQGSQIFRAQDGTFFLAAADGVSRSADGKDWSLVPGTGPLVGGLVSDGTTMYMSKFFYGGWGTNLKPYFSSPESDGDTWTQMESPGMNAGGSLGYDPGHRVLYSSNLGDTGFWRVVLP
jgi:hypothetical protein